MNRKLYLYILAGIFCTVLLAGGVLFLALPDRAFSETENRTLQTFPDISPSALADGRFEDRFETYVNDQFPFRDALVSVKVTADRLLGQTKSGRVFRGLNNTLMEDFLPPSAENAAALRDSLAAFRRRYADLSVYLMVAPTAVNILSEKLPPLAAHGDQNAYLDTLAADAASADIVFLDLRKRFLSQKIRTKLYYQTDHHWTSDGAYEAFQIFADAAALDTADATYDRLLVSDSFNGTLTASGGYNLPVRDEIYIYRRTENAASVSVYYADSQTTRASCYETEYLKTRDQYAVFFGGNHPLIRIRTSCKENRTLLVIKDSYANSLLPFLTDYYRKIIVVDPRYYYEDLGTLIEAERVQQVLFLFNANSLALDDTLPAVLETAS